MISEWHSPYQTAAYTEALADVGYAVDQVDTPAGPVYFDGSSGELTAWEVDGAYQLTAEQLMGKNAYTLTALGDDSASTESYYTLALSADSPRFSRRFMRNVAKATRELDRPRVSLAETPYQVDETIDLFRAHPDRRDGIPMHEFAARLHALGERGVLLSYGLHAGSRLIGASHVLTSDTQANLRYYTAERQPGAGHLLHHAVIEDLFSSHDMYIVDQSGVSTGSTDDKMAGIDVFKHQVGGELLRFDRHGQA